MQGMLTITLIAFICRCFFGNSTASRELRLRRPHILMSRGVKNGNAYDRAFGELFLSMVP